MCIRDRRYLVAYLIYNDGIQTVIVVAAAFATSELGVGAQTCLLYTSDAADERSSVDLGGRRIIKKKK